jgi:dienelactone hydrolase
LNSARTTFALIATLGCAQAQSDRLAELTSTFEYDRSTPLDMREIAIHYREGVKIHDLTYDSPAGGRVPAYLMVPDSAGPHAAILFGHWMMAGSPYKNRTEFLEEAVVLARAGAASLLSDAPFVRPGFVDEPDLLASAKQASMVARQQIVDFRRGIDLLMSEANIDARRIAYVGHSFDSHVGAILAAVEKRIQSFVLMASHYADEENVFNSDNPTILQIRKQAGDDQIRAYFREFWWDDPVYAVPHSAPAAVFLQFAAKDLPESRAREYFTRFAEPKQMKMYESGHELNAAARSDRVHWLVERLALRPVPDAELTTVLPALEPRP